MATIIEADSLSKRYRLGVIGHQLDNVRELLLKYLRKPLRSWLPRRTSQAEPKRPEHIWALRDVSFSVNEGEVVGIIGRNGAGKSTLLKILSRITEPTGGQVKIRGRLSSLLEVGTGFHPELTGRENIYLNGAILGMRKAEITAKFDEIVEFSEISSFLDTPVKRYSSGMYVKLAFSVAAHLNPEILVVDEVLAVGDFAFQKKCLGKMSEVSRGGRTILFVSHNMAAVENLCDTGMVLDEGQLVFRGNVKDSIGYYLRDVSGKERTARQHSVDLRNAPGRQPGLRPILTRVALFTGNDEPLNEGISIGAELRVHVSFHLDAGSANFDIHLGFNSPFGERVFTASTLCESDRHKDVARGDQTFVCEIPSLTLMPGEYTITIGFSLGSSIVDVVQDATTMTVMDADYYGTGKMPRRGHFVLEHHWRAR